MSKDPVAQKKHSHKHPDFFFSGRATKRGWVGIKCWPLRTRQYFQRVKIKGEGVKALVAKLLKKYLFMRFPLPVPNEQIMEGERSGNWSLQTYWCNPNINKKNKTEKKDYFFYSFSDKCRMRWWYAYQASPIPHSTGSKKILNCFLKSYEEKKKKCHLQGNSRKGFRRCRLSCSCAEG